MFIGIKKKLLALLYILFPFIYILYFNIIYILINLLVTSPIFLKDHKEFNILFYIHSSLATFNILLYFVLTLLFLIYFFTQLPIYSIILYNISLYGLVISVISLITGIFWGYFSWGQLIFFDNKTYLIIIISFIYLSILYILNNIDNNVNKIILILLLISLPLWKILSSWWTTFHQSFSISTIGVSFPSNLLPYFLILFIALSLSIIITTIAEIVRYLIKN